jgi:hypothetical protein
MRGCEEILSVIEDYSFRHRIYNAEQTQKKIIITATVERYLHTQPYENDGMWFSSTIANSQVISSLIHPSSARQLPSKDFKSAAPTPEYVAFQIIL